MEEQKIQHLQMIQTIISRMASNSFAIKGWSVTLVSALFALAAKETNIKYVLVAYFPALMFWFLDGYFLYQERLFRKKYDQVRISPSIADFSLSTAGVSNEDATWISATVSKTIGSFHGTILFTICAVFLYLYGR